MLTSIDIQSHETTMNTSSHPACCTAEAPALHSPSSSAVGQLWHGLAERWARHLETARQVQETEMMSELSADTLRDIGAPERWVERSVYRREAEELRLQEMRQWRNG
jgi:hypothetical protein